MTQQPFSRPGAVDLSGLASNSPVQDAPPFGAPGAGAPAQGRSAGSYTVEVDEQIFQSVVEASMTAPVVLVFYSASRAAESVAYSRDVSTVVEGYEGRFLAGLVDIDKNTQIAQALQVAQVPVVYILIDGRPATQPIPGVLNVEELRTVFQQLGQQLTAQGIGGRHKPNAIGGGAAAEEGEEQQLDPRYAPAQDALERGDIDAAVAEYEKLIASNPADTEAVAGLAMAKVLQRTQGVDLNAARAAAADAPDDIEAQTLVADLDLLGGHVEDSFLRLIDLVRRTSGDERNQARQHLLGLFAAVGNDDERVLKGRQSLASALF
ncbi:putative thioredoxin [Nocardioides albertanoniae]|uniref:Putative thioredoxin n=1 Tax=Nocardioides albertanoniae TaxID=1175486 RepID=A0A543A4K1_9ACTN|nr:tetratricopeptide repeat protein [Nocardioides albertanoniae]TQL67529.1 putative thioredoxin [Nocardioides albertanoniae]